MSKFLFAAPFQGFWKDFMPDALPDATLPIYLGLGPAL